MIQEENIQRFSQNCENIFKQIRRDVIGQEEVVEGVVVEILKFGAFVRFGPLDGLLHVSQIMDDRVDIDEANQRLVGKETGRFLAVGDIVKARVVSIDLNEKNPQDSKIGLTMRQPGLGKLQWLEEDRAKLREKRESGGEE